MGRQTTPCPVCQPVGHLRRDPDGHLSCSNCLWNSEEDAGREATGCIAPDCRFAAADGSAYCALHGVKWGRGEHVHGWDALRSAPPSWRCAYCGEVTEVRP